MGVNSSLSLKECVIVWFPGTELLYKIFQEELSYMFLFQFGKITEVPRGLGKSSTIQIKFKCST